MKISEKQAIDFVVLALRWYLAYYMADYGWSKLTADQFGHRSDAVLNLPLKDVDKFNLAWYLFSLDKTFDVVVGITQIIAAILIVINRTVLVGALLLLPVLTQIFLVDLAFTVEIHGISLVLRLACMVLADLLILFYYKEKMILVWKILTQGTMTKFRYKWWLYLLMPLIGLLTDFIIALLTFPIRFLYELFAK
ncbi:MAG TPA: hypothetical protein VL098_10875 [Flavipsychrobacter sp.]|nr:hypothetical protein [Flavipsychrobacter sp.]